MSREAKRVPMDFDWERDKVWEGYLTPDRLREDPCRECEPEGRNGRSEAAHRLFRQWYGYEHFDPASTGSEPFTVDTPAVRALAERNVMTASWFYGSAWTAVIREAERLLSMWNRQWGHHLNQDDVDALVEAGRLTDFTHAWIERRLVPRDPTPVVTPAMVNEWSLSGMGHDSINCGIAVRSKAIRQGDPHRGICPTCKGHATVEAYDGQRAEAEAWTPIEPPLGLGWQMWETTTEGSPQSPVFSTVEGLARWCAESGASMFGGEGATAERWLAVLTGTEISGVRHGSVWFL